MKIVICLGGLNKGGAERVVCNLSNYLQKNKNQVYLIVTKYDKLEYELDNNIEIISLEDLCLNKKYMRNFKLLKTLKRKLLEINPDVCLGFLQEPTARVLILKLFSKKIRRIPFIISVRTDPKHAFNSIKRKLSLLFYGLAEGFVFQTSEAQKFFSKNIQNKSVVIPNSLDDSFFSDLYLGERSKKIVSVGRLEWQKNYILLIEAFEKFLTFHKEYFMEIYGDGSQKEELIRLIKNKKLEKKVILKGNVSNVKEHIIDSKMFCIVSVYEGMSNALMEAMSLGIPCISSDSSGGGAASLIKSGENGFLVPVNDVNKLLEKMLEIAENDNVAKKISLNSWTDMKKFKPDCINKLWYNYIDDVRVRCEKNE